MATLSDSELKTMRALLSGGASYSPQVVQATPPAPSSQGLYLATGPTGPVTYSGSQPGLWYDPSKYDPNNRLSAINSLSGLQFHAATPETRRETESGDWITPAESAYVVSSNGTKLYLNGDANSGYTFSDRYNDPTGKSEKDQMGVTYKYDPATGTATPIAADPFYQPSDWVNTYRDVLTYAAPVVLAGLGGAYFGGGAAGGATGAEAGGVSGMDLAADAALGSGNNIVTAGGALGAGDVAAGAGGVSGMDLAADAPVGAGNNVTTAAGSFGGGGTAAENAALRQLFQENPSLGTSAASSGFLDALKSGGSAVADWIAKNPSVAAGLLGAIGGAASGGGGGDLNVPNYNAAATAQGQSARMNQSNPWGSLTYTQTGTDALGNPIYSQNVSLNPQLQSNLNSAWTQQGNAINNLFGGATQDAAIKQAQDAAYQKQTGLLDPQYAQLKTQLDASLANQGIGLGSDAYKLAQDDFARQRDYAYGNARDSAISQGNQMQQQLFGQNFQAATGLGNAVQSPTFASTPSATPYLQAAAFQGQGNLNQYNAKTGNQNAMLGGLFNLGGSLLSNPSFTNAIGSLFNTGG